MLTVRREQFRYMKNKYLTRFLCLTLMSGMVLSGPASVLAAEDTAAYTADGSDFSGKELKLTIPVILIQDQRIRRRQIRLLQSQHLRR